jgi:hypothetical protein
MVVPVSDADPTQLDSWLAIAPDGTVTVFSGKVDLGTGVETALAQIVAEELDVPFNKIHMIGWDTTKAIDQGITAGSRTIERGGPQLRQAAAAARQELIKLAAAKLNSAPETLVVKDAVVSVAGDAKKNVTYAQLIGGKRFNVKITATGTGWDMKVAPEVRAKDFKEYKIVGTSQQRLDRRPSLRGVRLRPRRSRVRHVARSRRSSPTITSKPASIDESTVKSIPGSVKIVQEEVSSALYARRSGRHQSSKSAQSNGATGHPNACQLGGVYLSKNTKSLRDQVTVNRGNPMRRSRKRAKHMSRLSLAFQLHA